MYQPRQSSGQPYGDIFDASLPQTEQAEREVSNHLWQQQQARMQYGMRQSAATDALMNREFAKVRSADIPDVTSAYQQYKALQKQLLFDQNLQRNPVEYNKVQASANESLANAMQKINESTEQGNQLKNLQAAYKAKPDLFADDFGGKFEQAMNMPTAALKNHPLGNPDNYRYQGSNINLQEVDKVARGTPQTVNYNENTPLDQNGIQSKVQTYKFGANPAQYKQSVLGYLATHKGERSAAYLLDSIPEDERNATHQAYINAASQDWLRKTGQPNPIDVSAKNPNNKSEQLASYLAEKSFLNNQPIPDKPQIITNADAKMNLANKLAKDRFNYEQPIRQRDRLIALDHSNANIEKRSQEAADAGSKYWENLKQHTINGVDANLQPIQTIPLDAKTKLDLSIDHKKPIDEVRITPNGYQTISGGQVLETLPETEIKSRIIKGMLGSKAAAKAIVPVTTTTSKKKIAGW